MRLKVEMSELYVRLVVIRESSWVWRGGRAGLVMRDSKAA